MRWLSLLVLLVLEVNCGPSMNSLKKRASFDMKCSSEKLEIIRIDYNTRGVRGCGQQATYVRINGTWVLNNNSTEEVDY